MGPTSATSPLTAVEKALRDSLLASEFRDVCLYAFSRRTILPDGTLRINRPLPIVAIGSILKNTEHFVDLLAAPSPVQQFAHSSEYDYESDSDLDEFEELQVEGPEASPAGPGPSSARGSSTEGKLKDLSADPANDQAAAKGSTVPETKRYRLEVAVPNIAYRTLRACVFYLYTGKTNFLPLTSSGAPDRQFVMLATSNDLGPPCSPKSIYRLAELYGLTELQDLAYNEIISQLSPENILEEAFSSFFARYDRLREHAVSYLSQNYSKPAVQQSLPDIIQRIALGEMPHASGVLRSLLGLRVAISLPTTGHHISHLRAFRPAHPPVSKPMRPSVFTKIDWQSFLEPTEPVVPVASPRIASDPLPPTQSSPATASHHIPSSSSIRLSAAARDLNNEEAPPAASEAETAERTAEVGAEGSNGSREPGASAAQAPDGVVQVATPGAVTPDELSVGAEEAPLAERRLSAAEKKRQKKNKMRKQPRCIQTETPGLLNGQKVPLSPLRIGSFLDGAVGNIRRPGYGPDRGQGETDEGLR